MGGPPEKEEVLKQWPIPWGVGGSPLRIRLWRGASSLEKCTSVDTHDISVAQSRLQGSLPRLKSQNCWVTLGKVIISLCSFSLCKMGEVVVISLPASLAYWVIRYNKACGGFKVARVSAQLSLVLLMNPIYWFSRGMWSCLCPYGREENAQVWGRQFRKPVFCIPSPPYSASRLISTEINGKSNRCCFHCLEAGS